MSSESATSPSTRHSYRELSPSQKEDLILRILRGEDPGAIAAEHEVAPERLDRWRKRFLAGGRAALREREDRDHLRKAQQRKNIFQWAALAIVLLGLVFFLVRILSTTSPAS